MDDSRYFKQDIIAVGYCQFSYNEQKGGFACCWSIKNPEVRSRIIISFTLPLVSELVGKYISEGMFEQKYSKVDEF